MSLHTPRRPSSRRTGQLLTRRAIWCGPALLLAGAPCAFGVVVDGAGTGPNADGRNLGAPTGPYVNSGYQYEGEFALNFGNDFVGTPISPYYFVTAAHIGAHSGLTFTAADGSTYTLDQGYNDPNSDLQIWHVTTPFATWAPLYTSGVGTETNKNFVVYGAGTNKGTPVTSGTNTNGWMDGTIDGQISWGVGTVAFTGAITVGSQTSTHVQWIFDTAHGGTNAGTVTDHDSGGGLFIEVGGVWELAAINHAVAPEYSQSSNGASAFFGAIINPTGIFDNAGAGNTWEAGQFASNSFATEIDQSLNWIETTAHVPSSWLGKNSGSWLTGTNWSAAVPGLTGDTATFGTNITSAATVTLDGNRTVSSLVFDSTRSYTIAQGTGNGMLYLGVNGSGTGPGTVNVNHGTHTISAPLSLSNGATVAFLNGSGLTVNSVAGAGPVSISGAGTMTVNTGGSLPSNIALSIGTGSALKLLNNGSPSVTILSGLTNTGSFDLGNNALIINYSGASVLRQIASMVASGRNGGAWNGTGLTSAYAASNVASIGIGYNEASNVAAFRSTFQGQSITTNSTAVLVQPALYGDITLAGTVNLDDLNIFSANFGKPTDQGWAAGDFLDQGSVTLDDLNLFAANFGKSLSGFPALTPSEFAQGEAILGSLGTATVPEPTGVMLLGMACAGMLARRRARR